MTITPMPSGKVHDSIAAISICPVFFIGHYLAHLNLWGSCVFMLATVFSQLMFGPDLDAGSKQYKRWGIFRWIWIPYRKLIPHRSVFSHGLLWGPIFRCLYLLVVITIFALIINQIIYNYTNINFARYLFPKIIYLMFKLKIRYLMQLVAGLFVGAGIHTITDKIFSFFKNLI